MRWIKVNLKTSIYNLLGNHAPPAPAVAVDVEAQTSRVRWAMLGSLGDRGGEEYPQIFRKVRFAGDVHVLWYCRSELMAALADMYGESAARDTMNTITEMFHGLLPDSLTQGNKRRGR